jgi:hypothetical protein
MPSLSHSGTSLWHAAHAAKMPAGAAWGVDMVANRGNCVTGTHRGTHIFVDSESN